MNSSDYVAMTDSASKRVLFRDSDRSKQQINPLFKLPVLCSV